LQAGALSPIARAVRQSPVAGFAAYAADLQQNAPAPGTDAPKRGTGQTGRAPCCFEIFWRDVFQLAEFMPYYAQN
jgi:hypothetical protein